MSKMLRAFAAAALIALVLRRSDYDSLSEGVG